MPQMSAPHWSIYIAVENGQLHIETNPQNVAAAEVAAICASVAAQLDPPSPASLLATTDPVAQSSAVVDISPDAPQPETFPQPE